MVYLHLEPDKWQVPQRFMIYRPYLGNLDAGGFIFMINRIKQQISISYRNVMEKSTHEALRRQKTLYNIHRSE